MAPAKATDHVRKSVDASHRVASTATRLANQQAWFVDTLGAMSSLIQGSARPEDVGHIAPMQATMAAQLSSRVGADSLLCKPNGWPIQEIVPDWDSGSGCFFIVFLVCIFSPFRSLLFSFFFLPLYFFPSFFFLFVFFFFHLFFFFPIVPCFLFFPPSFTLVSPFRLFSHVFHLFLLPFFLVLLPFFFSFSNFTVSTFSFFCMFSLLFFLFLFFFIFLFFFLVLLLFFFCFVVFSVNNQTHNSPL